jgi:hypothetical protein
VRVSETRRFFALPEGCVNIRLRSRQFVPVEQYADNFRQRWTDGAAKLAAGCRLIVIDTAGRGYYWSEHYENNVVALFGAQG